MPGRIYSGNDRRTLENPIDLSSDGWAAAIFRTVARAHGGLAKNVDPTAPRNGAQRAGRPKGLRPGAASGGIRADCAGKKFKAGGRCDVRMGASAWRDSGRAGGSHMIVSTGVDLAEVDRIQAAMEDPRIGRRFRDRVFTAGEIAYCEKKQ